MSLREISDVLGCNDDRVYQSLKRLWKKDIVLRTKSPVFLRNRVHRGRAGLVLNTRAVNYYVFNNGEELDKFVSFSDKMKDGRDYGVKSKSKSFYKIKTYTKRFKQNVVFLLLLFIVLMGTWCVPPKWTEKVVQELKAKYIVEKINEQDM